MQKAEFSIINYQFDKVKIDLTNHTSKELTLSFETKGAFNNADSTYELIFVVSVFAKNQAIPFVKIQCKGVFKFENVSSINNIPDFFFRNSIAILFPYVRAYLSIITTQANVQGIILPTLNLSHLEEELRKNTTLK